MVITNDKRIRTRPVEAQKAIDHNLKVVHLQGGVGHAAASLQLERLAKRWEAIEDHVIRSPIGPWWLSVRKSRTLPCDTSPERWNARFRSPASSPAPPALPSTEIPCTPLRLT
ncbi:hypothetical protein [Mycobacterium sp. SM1]|uniref:hypothetical protein n=1 Tax=Mycobacterium sp. SM1 TaxID=2816243 RepID=UPI0035A8739B